MKSEKDAGLAISNHENEVDEKNKKRKSK